MFLHEHLLRNSLSSLENKLMKLFAVFFFSSLCDYISEVSTLLHCFHFAGICFETQCFLSFCFWLTCLIFMLSTSSCFSFSLAALLFDMVAFQYADQDELLNS